MSTFYFSRSGPVRSLSLAVLALLLFAADPRVRADVIPSGDLTVTVEEQENGEVKFTLSGTAYLQMGDRFSRTNASPDPATPPATTYGSFGLPPGLKLTVPDRGDMTCMGVCGEEESVEEGSLLTLDLPLGTLISASEWYLGYFDSGPLQGGDPISGSGSVTTSNVPFSLFVPGTFEVGPAPSGSETEPSAPESAEASGISPYSITYEIIPFEAKPELFVSTPNRFPRTRLLRSGGTRQVSISNRGNVAIQNLSVSVTGSAAGDFSHGPLSVSQLAPGTSTRVSVAFKPRRKGLRRASLVVKGSYQPSIPTSYPTYLPPAASEEEIPAPEPQPPVDVSASAPLQGTGFLPDPRSMPLSPRFPFGPLR